MAVMEILESAGVDTLLGMGTVFLILMIISFVIYLFKFMPDKENSKNQAEETGREEEKNTGSEEIMAVIGAAIAAFNRENANNQEDFNPDEYVVRTIRKRGK